jgi:filamentous hemagglutinin family protein
MNKSFHSVWNASKQAYVAAAETVSAKGKPSSGIKTAAAISALFGGLLSLSAHAQTAPPPNTLPTGGQVSAGQASVSANGAHMVVNQSSNRAAINWQSFNVGKDAHVQFQQPSAASVTLNRVMSADPSQIFGRISANGQVVLTNPAGVYFGKDARVDVGGIVATTHGMSDSDFMAGKNRFERNGSTASVINEGEIKAALGGYIALLAPEVRNQGAIIAHMGTAVLAAGEAVDLHFDSSNRLTSIRVAPSQIAALVDNRHAVQAPGGLVIISAQSLDRLVGGVVKNSGRIEANGLQQQGGRIMLSASHRVENTGSISANATAGSTAAASGPAGRIEISAPEVLNSGSISATGAGQFSAGKVQVQATNFTQTDSGSIDLSAPSQGGQLSIQTTDKVELEGSVNAQATQDTTSAGTTSQGGQIEIAAQGDIEVNNATLDASGGQGGAMALRAKAPVQPDNPSPQPDAPGQGRLAIVGHSTLSTRGRNGYGGSATLLGERIELLGTSAIDATGATGGGEVHIGADPTLPPENQSLPGFVHLDHQSRIAAGGNDAATTAIGGSVHISSAHGLLQAAHLSAPTIEVNTKNLIDLGQWDASAATHHIDQGGQITVNASGNVEQIQSATWTVDGTARSDAGTARILAGQSAWLSGSISAQGQHGGQIAITTPNLVVAGAQLNANGDNGGGRIRVGGGWQGLNADLANANQTIVSASTLQASATQSGDGGEVVVWSENRTLYGGDIQARGGNAAGNGGQVEVSSHGVLQYAGQVNVTAPQGQNGRLLLDPKNIEIVATAPSGASVLSLSITALASRTFGSTGIGEVTNSGASIDRVYVANETDSTLATNAGAVRLFNSSTGELISTVTGTASGYKVGSGGVTNLDNGHLVVASPKWAGGYGAVSWMNGTTGLLANGNAQVNVNNSMTGQSTSDALGSGGVVVLDTHDYVVISPNAKVSTTPLAYVVTKVSGVNGSFYYGDSTFDPLKMSYSGNLTQYNSNWVENTINQPLPENAVKVVPLPGGKYVIARPSFSLYRGIVTFADGSFTGFKADGNNSLMGSFSRGQFGSFNAYYSPGDEIGSGGITVLSNGNYVVVSPNFAQYQGGKNGAVTWLNGANGKIFNSDTTSPNHKPRWLSKRFEQSLWLFVV